MRYSVRRLSMALGIAAPLLYLGSWVVSEVAYGVDDAYAQWGAADMVTAYLEDHLGQWPSGWDSLSPYFAVSNGRVGGWSYEKFQNRVWIDFTADPDELRRLSLDSDQPAFDVIGAVYSTADYGDGPDQQIHDYFRIQNREISAPTANSVVIP